jgi:hypothetical protein
MNIIMHKMSTTVHKSTPANVVSYLKKNRPTPNSSTDDQNSQNVKIKENISSAIHEDCQR